MLDWLLVPAVAAPLAVGGLAFEVDKGGLGPAAGNETVLWANAPDASVVVRNRQNGTWTGPLRWTNVMPDSVLISRGGVGEGTAGKSGGLSVPVALAGGGIGAWSLRPPRSPGGKAAFVLRVGQAWRSLGSSGQATRFALVLGGTPSGAAMNLVRGTGLPTYLLAGLKDDPATVRRRLGQPWQAFTWQEQRFIVLDNRAHKLGKAQFAWLERQVVATRTSGARRTWVLMHHPPVIPGGRGPDGLDDRREARKVARLLRGLPGPHLVVGHAGRGARRRWSGLDVAFVGPDDILLADLGRPMATPVFSGTRNSRR